VRSRETDGRVRSGKRSIEPERGQAIPRGEAESGRSRASCAPPGGASRPFGFRQAADPGGWRPDDEDCSFLIPARPRGYGAAVPSASNVAHRGLPFANPMSEPAVDRILDTLRLPPGALVLDTGCGSGEMLLRALGRDAAWRGLGVDLDPDAIATATERARARLPGRDVRFEVRDAATVTGRHDAVLNVGSSHVHGGWPAAPRALRALAADGGAVVFGEGYWRRPPSAAFLDALGGATADELPDRAGLDAWVRAAGFAIAAAEEASEADWARYEETLAANAERAGDPDSLAYARRIRARRALPDGASTLGFALLLLRASGP
jgi:SAM-dependent methyltransferase